MSLKDPTNDELRLRLGELTADECRIARAAYRLGWYARGEQDYKDAIAMTDGVRDD